MQIVIALIVVNLALGFAAGFFYGKHRAKKGFKNLIINTLNERENASSN